MHILITNNIIKDPVIEGFERMSKITDAINYLQSKVNNTHYQKIMKVLNQQQNQAIMTLIILAKGNSPNLEAKGREFIKSLSDFQKEELSKIVGKDVIDNLTDSLK